MKVVIDWLRSQGHMVLLCEGDVYQDGDAVVDASGLLGRANRLRAELSLEPFSRSLLEITHQNRRRHRGSLNLLVS